MANNADTPSARASWETVVEEDGQTEPGNPHNVPHCTPAEPPEAPEASREELHHAPLASHPPEVSFYEMQRLGSASTQVPEAEQKTVASSPKEDARRRSRSKSFPKARLPWSSKLRAAPAKGILKKKNQVEVRTEAEVDRASQSVDAPTGAPLGNSVSISAQPGREEPMTARPQSPPSPTADATADPTKTPLIIQQQVIPPAPQPWYKCWGYTCTDLARGTGNCLMLQPCRTGAGCCGPRSSCKGNGWGRCCFLTWCCCCEPPCKRPPPRH